MTGTTIVNFRRRRTYLDECRERGVFQLSEELKAENAEIEAQLTKIRERQSASIHPMQNADESRREFANAVEAQMQAFVDRVTAYLDAYCRVIDPQFGPLLRHAIFANELSEHKADALFRAACSTKEGFNND